MHIVLLCSLQCTWGPPILHASAVGDTLTWVKKREVEWGGQTTLCSWDNFHPTGWKHKWRLACAKKKSLNFASSGSWHLKVGMETPENDFQIYWPINRGWRVGLFNFGSGRVRVLEKIIGSGRVWVRVRVLVTYIESIGYYRVLKILIGYFPILSYLTLGVLG